jgi:hypothetical protein
MKSACILCQPQLFDGSFRVVPKLVPCARHRAQVQSWQSLAALGPGGLEVRMTPGTLGRLSLGELLAMGLRVRRFLR